MVHLAMRKASFRSLRTWFHDKLRIPLDLAITDLVATYKRTSLGWLWLVLTPMALLGIYTLVFGALLNVLGGARWIICGIQPADVCGTGDLSVRIGLG